VASPALAASASTGPAAAAVAAVAAAATAATSPVAALAPASVGAATALALARARAAPAPVVALLTATATAAHAAAAAAAAEAAADAAASAALYGGRAGCQDATSTCVSACAGPGATAGDALDEEFIQVAWATAAALADDPVCRGVLGAAGLLTQLLDVLYAVPAGPLAAAAEGVAGATLARSMSLTAAAAAAPGGVSAGGGWSGSRIRSLQASALRALRRVGPLFPRAAAAAHAAEHIARCAVRLMLPTVGAQAAADAATAAAAAGAGGFRAGVVPPNGLGHSSRLASATPLGYSPSLTLAQPQAQPLSAQLQPFRPHLTVSPSTPIPADPDRAAHVALACDALRELSAAAGPLDLASPGAAAYSALAAAAVAYVLIDVVLAAAAAATEATTPDAAAVAAPFPALAELRAHVSALQCLTVVFQGRNAAALALARHARLAPALLGLFAAPERLHRLVVGCPSLPAAAVDCLAALFAPAVAAIEARAAGPAVAASAGAATAAVKQSGQCLVQFLLAGGADRLLDIVNEGTTGVKRPALSLLASLAGDAHVHDQVLSWRPRTGAPDAVLLPRDPAIALHPAAAAEPHAPQQSKPLPAAAEQEDDDLIAADPRALVASPDGFAASSPSPSAFSARGGSGAAAVTLLLRLWRTEMHRVASAAGVDTACAPLAQSGALLTEPLYASSAELSSSSFPSSSPSSSAAGVSPVVAAVLYSRADAALDAFLLAFLSRRSRCRVDAAYVSQGRATPLDADPDADADADGGAGAAMGGTAAGAAWERPYAVRGAALAAALLAGPPQTVGAVLALLASEFGCVVAEAGLPYIDYRTEAAPLPLCGDPARLRGAGAGASTGPSLVVPVYAACSALGLLRRPAAAAHAATLLNEFISDCNDTLSMVHGAQEQGQSRRPPSRLRVLYAQILGISLESGLPLAGARGTDDDQGSIAGSTHSHGSGRSGSGGSSAAGGGGGGVGGGDGGDDGELGGDCDASGGAAQGPCAGLPASLRAELALVSCYGLWRQLQVVRRIALSVVLAAATRAGPQAVNADVIILQKSLARVLTELAAMQQGYAAHSRAAAEVEGAELRGFLATVDARRTQRPAVERRDRRGRLIYGRVPDNSSMYMVSSGSGTARDDLGATGGAMPSA
jgi:hypothetical protein